LFLMPLQLAPGAAVGEVAVTEDAGIVWGNASRCYQQPGENIRLVEWRYGGLFLMPLGVVWGNASRCYQQQGENISRQLSVLEIDIVLAHLNSPVDTEQPHRLCGGSSDHDSHRFRRNVEYRRFGIACIAAGIVDSALGNARPLPI
jgi:hypothetical protein